MSLIVDRRDFVVPGTYCARPDSNGRRHGFPTAAAYILVDEFGNEYPYGPSCVSQLGFPVSLRGIPDFTARDGESPSVDGHDSSAPSYGSNTSVDEEMRDLAIAKRYLLLRMEKIANIPNVDTGVRYAPLEDVLPAVPENSRVAPRQRGAHHRHRPQRENTGAFSHEQPARRVYSGRTVDSAD